MEGYCILYANYFADDPLHIEVFSQRYFWMDRKIFLNIFYAIRDFDTYFI
jgi:hypothetical protein